MILTHKIRIFPSNSEQKLLWILSEKCRLLYNFSLHERNQNWIIQQKKPKTQRKYITYKHQQNHLPSLKRKYPEYQWVYSKVLQITLKKLDMNFKSFFAKHKNGDTSSNPPRFRGKQYFFTICYNQSGFKIETDSIKFSHMHPSNTPLKFTLSYNPLNLESKVKQVEILHHGRSQKWFICITYEEMSPPYQDNGFYQAIDLGVSNLVSGINLHMKSIQIKNRRADKYWKKKTEEVQSKRDHCKKKSRRWTFFNNKFLKMKHKCANQLRDFQHKVSKKIVTNTKANTIVIGDLSPKRMAQKKKGTGNARLTKANKTLNYSILSTGALGRFAQFLTYKAEKIGKRVIRIDESFSSQTCCICSKIKKRKLYERNIICDCGNTLDRDINAAINIMERFLRTKDQYGFLSHKSSLTEESFIKKLDLLRNTAPSLILARDGGLVES
ncbi:MAG: RNA-guided endonuclease InsQ/TnpB family protein [Promethearchaeota archaeon]